MMRNIYQSKLCDDTRHMNDSVAFCSKQMSISILAWAGDLLISVAGESVSHGRRPDEYTCRA
eukprot:3237455-Pyramimonas_sp.AAC.2